ncbi:unnamed protein product [Periconia digitata]|uniref:Uncharacterized protein n=1 Tax=Periconia digitata TaxID=1303443 RepID=A0A9W4ULQ6_9PLEO|nr:unnamed protein product [Periconia digitata]
MNAQVQLAVELTRIFPVDRIIDSAYNSIINFARDLRKTGSDLLVEEELANIFGRGRINDELRDKFKAEVLKDNQVISFRSPDGSTSGLVLDSRPGPTLERALRKDDTRAFLATVIQVSLLVWMHERETLATALSQCMEARHQAGVSGATESPGIAAIQGMFEACSSQAGTFPWSYYTHQIELCIAQRDPQYRHDKYNTTLTPRLLLACIDYLYILQRLPEDRRMVVNSRQGFITLIVWGHYVLDLSVRVSGLPGGDLMFGNHHKGFPQVVINYSGSDTSDPDICLFDAKTRLVLTPEEPGHTIIESCERLPLKDYGTTLIWRLFNVHNTTAKNSPIYSDAVEYVIALALTALPRINRFHHDLDTKNDGARSSPSSLSIHRWQILSAAKICFASVDYSIPEIESYVQTLKRHKQMFAIDPPPSLLKHWEYELEIIKKSQRAEPKLTLHALSFLVIVLASVTGIDGCGEVPLVADIHPLSSRIPYHGAHQDDGSYVLSSGSLLDTLVAMMSTKLHSIIHGQEFMVSEHGWTVFLSSFEAEDPSLVVPERLLLRKGVPTKHATQERRTRVRDADELQSHLMSDLPFRQMLDRNTYIARCVERGVNRTEYYATGRSDFQLSIQHSVERYNGATGPRFDYYKCDHQEPLGSEAVRLPLGVATATGVGWYFDGEPERIIIALKKGDSLARWIAIAGCRSRTVVLRGRSTCISCTLSFTASLPGKWLVII